MYNACCMSVIKMNISHQIEGFMKIKSTDEMGELPVFEKKGIANISPPRCTQRAIEKSVEHGASEAIVTPPRASSSPGDKGIPVVEIEERGISVKIYKQIVCVVHESLVYIVFDTRGYRKAIPISDKKARRYIFNLAERVDKDFKRSELKSVIDDIMALAEEFSEKEPVYHRYAPLSSGGIGIEIDLCNPSGDRIEVNCDGWKRVELPSSTIFRDSALSTALPYPAEARDIKALREIFHLDEVQFKLLVAWLTYTMSNAKVRGSKFVHLIINGDQGTGKSFLSYIISRIIDPNILGIKALPPSERELGLILVCTHVGCFDNTRTLTNKMSDRLCQISSGATDISRQLYTNGDLHLTVLHGAVVLNGIHDIVVASDLAQRSLTFHLKKIPSNQIQSESVLLQKFESAHPSIFAYLLNLMAAVFAELPKVEVVTPERMIDFSRWLAAMEKVQCLEPGFLQNAYSENLKEAQLDTLQGSTLASVVLSFVESIGSKGFWQGTPQQLLDELEAISGYDTRFTRDFPSNPIAMSKRLRGLKASLLTQGVEVQFGRGKERHITIVNHNLG